MLQRARQPIRITCHCGANPIVHLPQLKRSKSRRSPALPCSSQVHAWLAAALFDGYHPSLAQLLYVAKTTVT
jgi:hypothetical protein